MWDEYFGVDVDLMNLPEDFASPLHPYVQEKFKELWAVVHSNPT
jgi:hypothetical protein